MAASQLYCNCADMPEFRQISVRLVHLCICDTSAQYCVSADHGQHNGFSRVDTGLPLMTSVKLAYLQDVTKHHFHINVGPTQLPAVYTCLCFAQPAPTSDHLPCFLKISALRQAPGLS